MHKCYQPILPSHNKLLQRRWDSTYYDEHRRKVQEARPQVDTRPPQTYMHLHLKLKKLQLEEERLSTVERDNRILLEKMSHVMRTQGRVDNRNNYEYKSLNREKRMRELLRVTQENQEILRRITQRKPQYNHMKWQKDWEDNQQFMDQIAAYPRDWWKTDEKSQRKREKSTMSNNKREKSTMSNNGSQKSSQREKKSKDDKEEKKGEKEQRRESESSDNEDRKEKRSRKKERHSSGDSHDGNKGKSSPRKEKEQEDGNKGKSSPRKEKEQEETD